ncbi:MAG: hypothetical protein U9Q31_01040 [Chloroflexota bacterium]|nr:hypothetical protein [Chloroflexota bacterium]
MSILMGDAQAIQHLKDAVAEGQNWYISLLEAIKLWVSTEEDYGDRNYRYLIDGEAFDWLLLAERLCREIDGFIPEKEKINLLFFDRPPIELGKDEIQRLVGEAKYKAYLNYLYGVLVEKFLILSVIEEIRKRRRALGLLGDGGITDEAHKQIYGATQLILLRRFRKERGYSQRRSIGIGEFDEFIYWLFKQRMRLSDKSLVASDTKRALLKLRSCLKLE